jgi:hypothetical protein
MSLSSSSSSSSATRRGRWKSRIRSTQHEVREEKEVKELQTKQSFARPFVPLVPLAMMQLVMALGSKDLQNECSSVQGTQSIARLRTNITPDLSRLARRKPRPYAILSGQFSIADVGVEQQLFYRKSTVMTLIRASGTVPAYAVSSSVDLSSQLRQGGYTDKQWLQSY